MSTTRTSGHPPRCDHKAAKYAAMRVAILKPIIFCNNMKFTFSWNMKAILCKNEIQRVVDKQDPKKRC